MIFMLSYAHCSSWSFFVDFSHDLYECVLIIWWKFWMNSEWKWKLKILRHHRSSVGSLENSNFASWIIFSSSRDLNRLFQFHKRLNFATLFFSMKSLHSVCLVIVAEIHFHSEWVDYSMGCTVSRHINTTHQNTTGNVQVKCESIAVKKCWKNVKCSLVTKYETSVSRCRLTSLT